MTRAVLVELRAKPERIEEFVALIDRHAHNSRTLEEGCLAFDVCQDPDDPAAFILYEVYRDAAAHAAHREMDSFKWFFKEAPDLLVPGADGTIFQSRRVLQRRPYGSG
jgi:(4S)-4-hydroxy-5-phosphonooxypentane-2,3-dione isomerase